MNGMLPPIERWGGKESEAYRYFANDFLPHRHTEWFSIWQQAAPIVTLPDVRSVLEFGGGRDVTRTLSRHFGIEHVSIDAQDRFYPDAISSILDYAFDGRVYDMVCSFECLEHNPFEQLPRLISHMRQFTNRYFYISLPYSGSFLSLSFSLRLPKFFARKKAYVNSDLMGSPAINVEPIKKRPPERQISAHWWEVGRQGFSTQRVVKEIEHCGLRLLNKSHNPFDPHHIFLMFEKTT
ncbi:class I SAM-dependent methyltransferase [Pseudorhodoplanes sp.]|uniref:class I SAM-dependent methyltransferase n=1 Tax=Pseudorhodoplanes sp. TaxID=1934341 RepID=UPI002C1AE2A0|nr:class I SAM-dependent methyltransferase [Pseudorhodoplanes sp.]HWV54853.1 class I SAM-dependent methyltransferase [Pseudorhodoplanes sp.]